MSPGEVASVFGSLLAFMVIVSLPGLASLHRAGLRYRRAVWRQLVAWWGVTGLLVAWLIAGWYLLLDGPRWRSAYMTATGVLAVLYLPALVLGIRAGNRALAAAQLADRTAAEGA